MEKQVIIDRSKDDSDEIPNVTDFSASSDIHMEKKVIIDISKDDSDEIPNLTNFSASSEISDTDSADQYFIIAEPSKNAKSDTPAQPKPAELGGKKKCAKILKQQIKSGAKTLQQVKENNCAEAKPGELGGKKKCAKILKKLKEKK